MVFMEQLQDYVETAGAMLLMHGMYLYNFTGLFELIRDKLRYHC